MSEATESDAIEAVEPGEVRVRRALLSVSDKRGLVEFARGLAELGIEIVSTGGTARELEDAGIGTRSVEDYTGFPEILDGRVKTLNPRIYAGLLAVRSNPEHVSTLGEHSIEPIDLVCVNLYPFERVASRRGADDAEVIENIDIGGPTLIRAAAKNYPFAAVVVRPESYDAILDELGRREGRLSEPTREALATEAFSYTARYDAAISRWFSEKEESFPGLYVRAYEKVLDLSYGENPHQRAAYYAQAGARTDLLSMVSKLHGKELSFNNLLDLDSGRKLLEEFEVPAATILKHNNPCGTAVGKNAIDAYDRALACDPLSAYGGVYCFNRRVDRRAGGAPERHLRGARVRARVRRGRVRGPRPEAQHPHPRGPGAPARAARRPRHAARTRGHPRAGPRQRDRVARRDVRGHRGQAHGGAVGRPAVCLARVQARALERDRPREGPRHGRDRRRPDEPSRFRARSRSRRRRARSRAR